MCEQLKEILRLFQLEELLEELTVAGIEFRHLQYLNEGDIADAVKQIGKRAEFREKLFAWRRKNVCAGDELHKKSDQDDFHYVDYYYIQRKGKRPPTGKLYSKYTNIRAKKRKVEGAAKQTSNDLDKSTPDLLTEFDESIEATLKEELRRESSDWQVVLDRWDRSYHIRQRDLSRLSNFDFIKEWPKLKDVKGPELINSDFKRMYPNKEHLLKSKWSTFKQKIGQYYYLNIANAACKSLLLDLSCVKQIDAEDCILTTLIHSVLPPTARFQNTSGALKSKATILVLMHIFIWII